MNRLLFLTLLLSSLLEAKSIYATCNVTAEKSANLAFTTGGSVAATYAEIGQYVTKASPLAALKNDDLKALLDRAQTDYKYAKRAFDRQNRIKHLIDAAKFDAVAKRLELAKESLAYQKALYEKSILKAPFDGLIFYKNIEVGDAISGMMLKTVYKIQSRHKRKLIVEFDEKYAQVVKVGDTYRYTIDGFSQSFEGRIVKIYPQANIKKRTMSAEVIAKDLPVGLFGSGTIETQE